VRGWDCCSICNGGFLGGRVCNVAMLAGSVGMTGQAYGVCTHWVEVVHGVAMRAPVRGRERRAGIA